MRGVDVSNRNRKKRHASRHTAAISFTFDDGMLSTYTHAFPALREAGFVGHIAVVTDLVGTPNHYTWDHITEMAAAGWEVESHSCTHNLGGLTPEKLRREIVESKHVLEAHGLTVRTFNFPGGSWEGDAIFLPGGAFEQEIRRNYSAYLPVHNRMPHPMKPPIDPYRLSWQTAECHMADQFAAPLDAMLGCIDEAIAGIALCNSLWHDVTVNNRKHWPKFLQVVEYAASHVRAGRLRCVTTSQYLRLDAKSDSRQQFEI